MAYSFDVNTIGITCPVAVFKLVTLLLAKGWTKPKDSDGTTYSSAGTQVTSGAAGAGGLANNSAWFLLKHPSTNRTFCFQRGTANLNWRVSYCADNAFTSGTPGATRIPAPAGGSVEVILLGAGTDAAPTYAGLFGADSTFYFHAEAGGSDEDYAWIFWGVTPGASPTPAGVTFYDPMLPASYVEGDPDPSVVACTGSGNGFGTVGGGADSALMRAWMGPINDTNNNRSIGTSSYGIGYTVSSGTNPVTGKESLIPVPWVRRAAPGGGMKGYSRLFRQPTGIHTMMTPYTVESANDFVGVITLVLPWNGSAPKV